MQDYIIIVMIYNKSTAKAINFQLQNIYDSGDTAVMFSIFNIYFKAAKWRKKKVAQLFDCIGL